MQPHSHPPPPPPPENRYSTAVISILAAALFSLLFLLILSLSSTSTPSPQTFFPSPSLSSPSLAYLLYGSSGDSLRLLRLLSSVYHPNNRYLLHLDRFAPHSDRRFLAEQVAENHIYKAARNVDVVGKADHSYGKGSSRLSSVLHGASILLSLSDKWDWFVCLSADDYPLVTQDDLLHILSYLPKDLNFINHTSYIGWRESRSLKRIIVDPGLYLSERSWMFYATQKRNLPDAFHLFTEVVEPQSWQSMVHKILNIRFLYGRSHLLLRYWTQKEITDLATELALSTLKGITGSSSTILSRQVVEFSILGTDNFPRTLLMYLANTPSSSSFYFPTLLCNSHKFNKTIINHSLHYTSSLTHPLRSTDFENMINSGSAFASPFIPDDPVLDRIDSEILGRGSGKPVPGGWCLGESENDTCSVWGDASILRPGPGATRLEKFFVGLLSNESFGSHQCIVE